jgi:hypothetical protein
MAGFLLERDSSELYFSPHRVYVTGPHITPQSGIYSSTLRAADAAVWPTESAARMAAQRHSWAGVRIVPADAAPDLPEPRRLTEPRTA